VEEKWPVASEVLQFFRFGEKKGRGNTRFEKGNEHKGRLLVLTWKDYGGCSSAVSAIDWSRVASGLT
jgi:hypothetical protein